MYTTSLVIACVLFTLLRVRTLLGVMRKLFTSGLKILNRKAFLMSVKWKIIIIFCDIESLYLYTQIA